jgi:hypothetical protein
MGLLVFCNLNNKFHITYNDWTKVIMYLALTSLNYINIVQKNILNDAQYDNFKNYVINLTKQIKNSNHDSSNLINSINIFYDTFIQILTSLQLQGIKLLMDRTKISYTYNESINIKNTLDTIEPLMYNETDNMIRYSIKNIYNIHNYSIENKQPIFIM